MSAPDDKDLDFSIADNQIVGKNDGKRDQVPSNFASDPPASQEFTDNPPSEETVQFFR